MAEETPVRIGIIGCASIAKKYVRAINLVPGLEIVSLGSRSARKAAQFANEVGLRPITKLCGSYLEVVEDPLVDVVYIPLPTSLHLEWVTEAARRGKHVLIEKPIALSAEDLNGVIRVCMENKVQLMDGTMWMHNPRTDAMKKSIDSKDTFGEVRWIHCSFSFLGSEDFMTNDIRVKPDLDGLGCLGDLGWYCIRASLWAMNFEMPEYVVAQPGAKRNSSGVLINCGATLVWTSGCVASFVCGFDVQLQQTLTVSGSKKILRVDDFVIPVSEDTCAFEHASEGSFVDDGTSISMKKEREVVRLGMPQEALMVQRLGCIVRAIREGSGGVDESWITYARLTQVVLNAVAESLQSDCQKVLLA